MVWSLVTVGAVNNVGDWVGASVHLATLHVRGQSAWISEPTLGLSHKTSSSVHASCDHTRPGREWAREGGRDGRTERVSE